MHELTKMVETTIISNQTLEVPWLQKVLRYHFIVHVSGVPDWKKYSSAQCKSIRRMIKIYTQRNKLETQFASEDIIWSKRTIFLPFIYSAHSCIPSQTFANIQEQPPAMSPHFNLLLLPFFFIQSFSWKTKYTSYAGGLVWPQNPHA